MLENLDQVKYNCCLITAYLDQGQRSGRHSGTTLATCL